MTDLPFSESFDSGDLVFISGQVPLDVDGNMIEGTIEELTRQTMNNVGKVLKASNLDYSNIVMTYIYLTDINDAKIVSDVYVSYLKKPYPARVTLGVASLPLDSKVEISVIAKKK